MPTRHQSTLGELGETLACRELRRRGYVILARRYRTRHGEIDIVAVDRSVLVFAEVKTRTSGRYGGALAAVTPAKQRKLTLMALDYLARSHTSGIGCRFDVVGVVIEEGRRSVEVVTNAFTAASSFR